MRSGLTNTYITSSAAVIRPVHCVYMDFSGSVARATNAHNDITMSDDFGGGTYSAVGDFGMINNVVETEEISAKSIELTLSGIPQDKITLALTNQYRGRAVCVYLLLYSEDFSTYEKTIIFRGRMDTMTINEGEDSATIKIVCENRLIELQRAKERRYTNEELQRLHPGDLGLQYVAGAATEDLYWGSAVPGGANVSQGGNSGRGYSGNSSDYYTQYER